MIFSDTKSETLSKVKKLRNISTDSTRNVLTDADGKFQKDLNELEDQINTVRFIVGIVGGFNVGKSTFLNALLGRKLLSTDILPETAAITSLNYGEKDNTTVNFWTKREWDQIEKQGKYEDKGNKLSKITKMANEVKDALGNQFNELITDDGKRIENISLNELVKYISANVQGGYAKLVREVEVATNLEFCKDNIQIVDTPGLNDPVQFRELTVNNFLQRCDLLVLLLPAKQAFTDYDRKFLEKRIEKGQIHKLFVIINQIDLLQGKESIETVLNFTRQQLKETFEESENEISADLVNDIEIFPISAYQSFLNRTGQITEAKLSDEESGVPIFETRLRQFLFDGERAQKIQKIWQSRLRSLIKSQLELIDVQLAKLDIPIEELEKYIKEQTKIFEIMEFHYAQARSKCDETILNFRTKYEDHIDLQVDNIGYSLESIQVKAFEKINDFSNSNFIKVIADVKSWPQNELEPFINKQVKKEMERISNETEEYVKGIVDVAIADIEDIYKGTAEEIKEQSLDLPNVEFNPWTSVGNMMLAAVAAGFGANAAVGTAIANYIGLAGAYIVTGPVGWAIGVGSALLALYGGGELIKEKICDFLKKSVKENLTSQINSYAKEYKDAYKKIKANLVDGLREMAENPVREIQKGIKQQQDNLNQLLEDKKRQEFDIQEKRNALNIERASFEQVLSEINTIAKANS